MTNFQIDHIFHFRVIPIKINQSFEKDYCKIFVFFKIQIEVFEDTWIIPIEYLFLKKDGWLNDWIFGHSILIEYSSVQLKHGFEYVIDFLLLFDSLQENLEVKLLSNGEIDPLGTIQNHADLVVSSDFKYRICVKKGNYDTLNKIRSKMIVDCPLINLKGLKYSREILYNYYVDEVLTEFVVNIIPVGCVFSQGKKLKKMSFEGFIEQQKKLKVLVSNMHDYEYSSPTFGMQLKECISIVNNINLLEKLVFNYLNHLEKLHDSSYRKKFEKPAIDIDWNREYFDTMTDGQLGDYDDFDGTIGDVDIWAGR